MAKQVIGSLKLRIPAGQATAGPPVGSTLGQWGLNMMDFINPFNEATKELKGVLTAHITIYEDRSMDFRYVTAATDELIREKIGIQKGSGKPNTEKIEKKLSDKALAEIAEVKARDMNTEDIDAVKKMVSGTARSMGVEIEGQVMIKPEYVAPGCSAVREQIKPETESKEPPKLVLGHIALQAEKIDVQDAQLKLEAQKVRY